MKVIGYTRTSSADQGRSGLGLAAQRHAIEAHADAKGWEVVWLSDDSSSGKSLRRPGIQKALAMLAAHDADAIVTAKLDRLTRSVKDFMGLLETSARQRWDIVVLDFQLDTTTASGRMSAGMMMQFAQFERELIGERTKAALAAAKSRGVVLGARPSIDPEVQALISELRDAGLGARRIAARLNEDGVPTVRGGRWQPSTVARVFVRLDTPDGLAPYMGVRFDKDKEAE